MNKDLYIVQLNREGRETRWITDLITPEFGNPYFTSYPKLTNIKSEAWEMPEDEAMQLGKMLRYDGDVGIVKADRGGKE